MTQLGEGVAIGVFVSVDGPHTKQTCPWHAAEEPASADPMDEQLVDEDAHGSIPANLGKKLGDNLKKANIDPPSRDSISVAYRAGEVVAFKQAGKNKRVQSYEQVDVELYDYPLQYAPHHLIPGNESLKGSEVLAYMGDDSVIKAYKPPRASEIKKGKSIGYDVNAAQNGVWLPSPYALSNSNQWPSQDGIEVLLKRMGQIAVDEAEGFKSAYVAASIEASGHRQFHMRHEGYSNEVKKILNSMADKMDLLSSVCPEAPDPDSDLFNPPPALKAKLNALSTRMSTLLTGPVWRPPYFTDHLTEEYAASLKKVKRSARKLRVM
jgi:hypothetical protein